MGYQKLLDHFSAFTQECFGDQLTGIYLHGSMAMGCFYAGKSDIDLIVIIERDIPVLQKIAFLNQMIQFNGIAPAKGSTAAKRRKDSRSRSQKISRYAVQVCQSMMQFIHIDIAAQKIYRSHDNKQQKKNIE